MLLEHSEVSLPTLTSNMMVLTEFSTDMLDLTNEQNKLVPELGRPTTVCFIKTYSLWFVRFGRHQCQHDRALSCWQQE